VLKASDKILTTLSEGFKLEFDTPPPVYMERNNATVRNNLKDATELIFQMRDQGIIDFTDIRPHCVNPLGLVIKEDDNGRKLRLIFDASRCLNKVFIGLSNLPF